MKRKTFEKKIEDRKSAEKRDKWLRELEARDEEDRAWRARIEKESAEFRDQPIGAVKAVETQFPSKSVSDQVTREGWGKGIWVLRARDAWRRS